MKNIYIVTLENNEEGAVENTICDDTRDLHLFIGHFDEEKYTIKDITVIDITDKTEFLKPTDIETGI